MKRFLFLTVAVFFACFNAHGQALVFDAFTSQLLENNQAQTMVKYALMLKDSATQIEQFITMIEQTGKQIDMSMQNLANLKNIDSWNGFKEWYNNQLYLEHMAVETVKGMDITIGKKNYSLWDIDSIADGLDNTYGEGYWNKEFTEEQRREMWITMGLTPANYAYVQPYRQKAREISREMLAMSEIQNRKNQAYNYEIQRYIDAIQADARKPSEQQMGEKAYLQIQTSSLFRIEQELMDISSNQAKMMEAQGVNDALNRPLHQTPEFTKFPDNAWDLNNK